MTTIGANPVPESPVPIDSAPPVDPTAAPLDDGSQVMPPGSTFPADSGVFRLAQEGVTAKSLAQIPLFSGLTDQDQAALFSVLRVEKISANQTIVWHGDVGDRFFLVSKGTVEVSVPDEHGRHVILNRLGPGGFFGEISLLDGGPRTASVRAVDAAELFVLDRTDFHRFLARHPNAAIQILAVMGQRARTITEALRTTANANVVFRQSQAGPWQRVSDVVAAMAAHPLFLVSHVAWFGGWLAVNLLARGGYLPPWTEFDPFPFGMLTMVVSLEAIFLSIFVLVSQDRQAEKDRLAFDLDYQVNVKAQTEIMALGRRLQNIEAMLAATSGDAKKSE